MSSNPYPYRKDTTTTLYDPDSNSVYFRERFEHDIDYYLAGLAALKEMGYTNVFAPKKHEYGYVWEDLNYPGHAWPDRILIMVWEPALV